VTFISGNLSQVNAASSSTVLPVAKGGTGNNIGNTPSANKLYNARNINGLVFDGTQDITLSNGPASDMETITSTDFKYTRNSFKIVGGLILNWGKVEELADNKSLTIEFKTPFSNTNYTTYFSFDEYAQTIPARSKHFTTTKAATNVYVDTNWGYKYKILYYNYFIIGT
jgi:hypothetical protein